MYKYKFFLDFEKEEKWLNQMAKQGYDLTGKSLGYRFHKATPKDTVIRIDYRTFKRKEDFEDYRMLFRDSGWEHVAGTKSSGTQYFRKVEGDDEEDIFSDIPSRAVRYKKLSHMSLTLAITYLPILIALVNTKAIDVSVLLNPKLLYYTPGLWEETGISFWWAFLFETPFAIMRGFSWLFLLVLVILYFVYAVIAQKNYRRFNNQ